jgi:photosystem II stability/assembly factor-like uncharacterized protein
MKREIWAAALLIGLVCALLACDQAAPTLAPGSSLPAASLMAADISPTETAAISPTATAPRPTERTLSAALPTAVATQPMETPTPLRALPTNRAAAPSATTMPSATETRSAATATLASLAAPLPADLTALTVSGPLLVDDLGRRLYGSAWIGQQMLTLAWSAEDGKLLANYPITGALGLDAARGWLYVDQGAQGLAVLDRDGVLLKRIALPPNQTPYLRNPAPLADPRTGQVIAFRDETAYLIETERGVIGQHIPFIVPSDGGSCGKSERLPISLAAYDPDLRLLYLAFHTYVCTPWLGLTIVSYDLSKNAEIARSGSLPLAMTAADGRLFVSSWYRMGFGDRALWRDGQPVLASSDWRGGASPLFYDAARGRLYEGNLRILDAETMTPLANLPPPVAGSLVAFDPRSDQLYFFDQGNLRLLKAAALALPAPEPPRPATPPRAPVSALWVSPGWPADQTLWGLWKDESDSGDCFLFGQQGYRLYMSSDGGKSWSQPRGGLAGCAESLSAFAPSAAWPQERVLLANVTGLGVHRSADGGQLWRPASAGLPSMASKALWLSPGFAQDQTAYAHLSGGELYATSDGGVSWRTLNVRADLVAMSPDFARDHTLMALGYPNVQGIRELLISRDGGVFWDHAGNTPGNTPISWISLAPAFEKWKVMFAYSGESGTLYRSENGGAHWTPVLLNSGYATSQLVYAPDIESNRPLYLIANRQEGDWPDFRIVGALYRSLDGGLSWHGVALPTGNAITAIAISPRFAQDHLLFLGAADGRVVTVDANTL